jgi:hypothetical protein
MADNLNKRSPEDPKRINMAEAWDLLPKIVRGTKHAVRRGVCPNLARIAKWTERAVCRFCGGTCALWNCDVSRGTMCDRSGPHSMRDRLPRIEQGRTARNSLRGDGTRAWA